MAREESRKRTVNIELASLHCALTGGRALFPYGVNPGFGVPLCDLDVYEPSDVLSLHLSCF